VKLCPIFEHIYIYICVYIYIYIYNFCIRKWQFLDYDWSIICGIAIFVCDICSRIGPLGLNFQSAQLFQIFCWKIRSPSQKWFDVNSIIISNWANTIRAVIHAEIHSVNLDPAFACDQQIRKQRMHYPLHKRIHPHFLKNDNKIDNSMSIWCFQRQIDSISIPLSFLTGSEITLTRYQNDEMSYRCPNKFYIICLFKSLAMNIFIFL